MRTNPADRPNVPGEINTRHTRCLPKAEFAVQPTRDDATITAVRHRCDPLCVAKPLGVEVPHYSARPNVDLLEPMIGTATHCQVALQGHTHDVSVRKIHHTARGAAVDHLLAMLHACPLLDWKDCIAGAFTPPGPGPACCGTRDHDRAACGEHRAPQCFGLPSLDWRFRQGTAAAWPRDGVAAPRERSPRQGLLSASSSIASLGRVGVEVRIVRGVNTHLFQTLPELVHIGFVRQVRRGHRPEGRGR
mmetsp:Transcript_49654/g.115875  ORF Transcript_49654/g.115875 Transcript_49654/m.115875 type:complete len:247 (+) Transcript_49654:965-1705(+)